MREIHVAGHIKRAKKARQAELLTGIAGPLVGSKVCGEVLLRGGARGSKLDVYSSGCKGSWLRHSGAIPTGKLKIERVVDGGPQLKAGFHPSSSSSRSVQFQSADGWWFAEEAEALSATQIFTNGKASSPPPKGDDGWAGSVAFEDPLEPQDKIFELPKSALTDWGVQDPATGSARSRYKPPVSAKGLLPPALPPDKRRSGASLGIALDCCRSLEKNLPDPMKPAVAMIALSMPEEGLSACLANASPCAGGAQAQSMRGQLPEAQTLPLMMTPEMERNGFLAPSFTSSVPTDKLNPWANAALMAERKISAEEPWTLSDADASVEVLPGRVIGLPDPTLTGLKIWYRSIGLIVD